MYIGSNIKQLHGDKWYKVIEHNSDYDEHELSDDDDLNNNQVNNQLLSSNYKNDVDTMNSSKHSRFFDCFIFRRNYKRNRKKISQKGQFKLQFSFISLSLSLYFSRLFPILPQSHPSNFRYHLELGA